MEYDEEESRRTERAYLSPEIIQQRARTIEIINLAASDIFIDVGCGPGLLAYDMAKIIGPEGAVICVDSSAPMIALAEARCKNLPHVSSIKADATNLPVNNRMADVVVCTQLLLYVEPVETVLAELYRVLKPGGSAYVMETDWRSTVVHSSDNALTEKIISAWDAAVANPRLPPRLGPLLRKAGFHSIDTHAIPLISTQPDAERFAMSMLRQCVIEAQTRDIVTEQQGGDWIAQFAALARDDGFFFCVNRFLFAATK